MSEEEKKYRVQTYWIARMEIDVEADNVKEAIETAYASLSREEFCTRIEEAVNENNISSGEHLHYDYSDDSPDVEIIANK